MKAAIVGTGYVGLVSGVVFADAGIKTICVDNDQAKLKMLRSGKSPIFEPGLEEMMQRVEEKGHISFTDSISDAVQASDVIFIAVGTPPQEDGSPDLSYVKAVARDIGRAITKYIVIVDKSTVPVGTAKMVHEIILGECGDASLFDVVSSPEFLREGSAVEDTVNPDRVVIGADSERALNTVKRLYTGFPTEILETDIASAELIKYASNCFLATKISFINMISRYCEAAGGNVDDVAKGMGMDTRIGKQFLKAGLGWGGSCFPKDVSALIWMGETLGVDAGILTSTVAINEDQPAHCLRRVSEELGGLEGKKIAIFGLSFKPHTDDIRDAKSLVIIDALRSMGASISATDPICMDEVAKLHPDVEMHTDAISAAQGADAAILVTEWPEYAGIELSDLASALKTPLLFDGRRVFTAEDTKAAGIKRLTIGEQG
jgi:UDPglucose 6-dehydrogenase